MASQAARLDSRTHRREAGKAAGSIMDGFVYTLRSLKDNKTYTGSTDNLERRLLEHQSGKCAATRHRKPLELIYSDKFDSLVKKKKKEQYFKTASGRRALREILKGIFDHWGVAKR